MEALKHFVYSVSKNPLANSAADISFCWFFALVKYYFVLDD